MHDSVAYIGAIEVILRCSHAAATKKDSSGLKQRCRNHSVTKALQTRGHGHQQASRTSATIRFVRIFAIILVTAPFLRHKRGKNLTPQTKRSAGHAKKCAACKGSSGGKGFRRSRCSSYVCTACGGTLVESRHASPILYSILTPCSSQTCVACRT